MSQTIHKFIRQAAVWVTVLVVCLSTIANPFFAVPAEAAYHQTYIQTTIDVSSWDILGGVVDVKSGGFLGTKAPLEYSRIGGGVLDSLAGAETPSGAASYITSDPNGGGGSKEKNLVLTFPGTSKADGPSLVHTESTDRDSARAGLVLNSLLFDLNAAFKFVYGDASGSYTPDGDDLDAKVEQYRADMQNLLRAVPSGSVNGAAITNSSGDIDSFVDSTVTASDYVTITKDGETRTFQFRMLKGYVNAPGELGLVIVSGGEDAKYVHWGHFAVEAFLNYASEDKYQVTADTVYNSTPTAGETIMAGLLGRLCDFVANALGLWDFDQLIFNAGARGSAGYVGGIFPSTWQPLIWAFFFIAEIGAIGVLLYSIIVNVGRKALSTVNPIARASAISQIESLFFVAIALGLLPLVIQLSIGISSNLTGIFKDALGGTTAADRFGILTSGSGALGAIVTRIIYLGAVIYFNFFYGIRALTIAFLIITGPVFISFVGVSEKKRMLAETWAREFAANLFIQPLQAMMMSFILLLPSTGRTFDAIVLAYAMIPLTHMIRGLFFGSAGSFAHQLADKGRAGTMRQLGRAGTAAVATAGGAVLGGAGALYNAMGSPGSSSGSSGGESGNSAPAASSDAPKNQREFNDKRNQQQNDQQQQQGQQEQQQQQGQREQRTAAQQAASSGGQSGAPVSAGNDTDSSAGSNNVVAGIQNGQRVVETENAGAEARKADDGKDAAQADGKGTEKQKPSPGAMAKGIGLTAAAVGLGALGGATSQFNRRVFGVFPGPGGGIITQISRNVAGSADRTLHPSTKSAPETSGVAEGSQSNEGQAPNGTGTPGGSHVPPSANPNRPDDAYLPDGDAYEGNNLDANNVYENGLAEKDVAEDGTTEYQIPRENLSQAGVRVSSDKASGTTKLSYNLNNMSASDANRARELAALYEYGTEEEKQVLQEAGIESIHCKTHMNKETGQEEISGVEMTVRPDALKEHFGIDTKPASMGGKGLAVSTPNAQTAPNLVPDATQHLNNTMARSFSQSVQSAGGSVVPDAASGTTQVTIPTAQFKPFTEKYPSLDTSSATQSGDLTTFSVPSSTLLEGTAPQSPTLRTINQNRFGGAAPVQVPPVAGPTPPPAPSGGVPEPPLSGGGTPIPNSSPGYTPPPVPAGETPEPVFSGGGAPIPDSGPGYTPPTPPTPVPSGAPTSQPAGGPSAQPNHEPPAPAREKPPKTDGDPGKSERKP